MGFAECWRGRDGLGLGVDRAETDARVFRPVGEGDQSPSHENNLELTCVAVQSDDGLKSLRSNVPTRPEVREGCAVNREVLRDLLLVRAPCIVATHRPILLLDRFFS
jgi:hypothetical protein